MFKKHLMAAALGVALAGSFVAAQAANVSATVVTDSSLVLDVLWTGNLQNDAFLLPTLTNWDVPSLQVSTSSVTFFGQTFNLFAAQLTADHEIAPHSGEFAPGLAFDSGVVAGTFGQYSSYSAMAYHNDLAPTAWVSPANWITPHWDHYSFSVNSAANGNATLELKALHPVPEPESYAMLLAGLGLMGIIARRRRRQS